MEIDDLEYLNLDIDNPEELGSKESKVFMKQTLLHSPIFQNIFPRFHVSTNNDIRRIRGLSHQDDSDQYLSLQEEDSQFGTFNDEDLLIDMSQSQSHTLTDREAGYGNENNNNNNTYETDVNRKLNKLQIIPLIVKNTSLLVNGLHFSFNSYVRSSCIIKGIRNNQVQEQDSLFISLKSGFLLLIRLFYVPISFHDTDYNENFTNSSEKMIFKPFVVQWWDTSSYLHSPSIFSSGNNLLAHCSGLAAVSTSSSGSFRIFNCNHTSLGVLFQPHYNVPVSGSILHSCFAQPIKGSILDNHVMFLIMNFTTNSSLELNLYAWTTTELLNESLTKSTLPLPATFPVPIFVASLSNNGSFLFVTSEELIIITVHDITSAEYNFKTQKFNGSFPTNYYYPRTDILLDSDESNIDELLISTDNGSIFSIIINNGDIQQVLPIIRISDPISIFTLEAVENGYELIYGSDLGLNRKLLIESLFQYQKLEKDSLIPYSQSLLLSSYKNWGPILDVQIIDSFKSRNSYQNSKQEFWCISGIGKRARLTQLRYGYSIARISRPYQSLRKVEKMFLLNIHTTTYICCSLPFETVFLEYQPGNDEEIIDVSEVSIKYDSPTISMSMLNDDVGIQITPQAIILTSIDSIIASKNFNKRIILFADILSNFVLVISQESDSHSIYQVEVFQVLLDEVSSNNVFNIIYSVLVNSQISFAKLLIREYCLFLATGDFDGEAEIRKLIHINQEQDENLAVDNKFTNSILLNLNTYLDSYQLANVNSINLVPQDILLTVDGMNLLLGTRDGYLFHFTFDTTSNLIFTNYFKLSDINVDIHQVPNVPSRVIISCKSLWLMDFDESSFPEPILFDEKNDKLIKSILPIANNQLTTGMPLLIVRDEGLSIANVSDFKIPNVKQINIGGSAKKFLYLPYLSIFVILSDSKDSKARLRYVDRKSYKLLSHVEINNRPKGSEDSIFEDSETPICSKVWSLDKLGKRAKKLLIGCATESGKGSFKILDITKTTVKENKQFIKVVQLIDFEHVAPITCIEQVGVNIIFASGFSIYSTVYNTDEKRLQPITLLVALSSEINSILVENDKLISVTTKFDSVYQFEFITDDFKSSLKFIAEDPSSKSVTNHALINSTVVVADKYHSDIILMQRSDKSLITTARFKSFGIPRVYKANFEYFWTDNELLKLSFIDNADNESNNLDNDKNTSGIVSVTVDGEITLFKEITDRSKELKDLQKNFNISVNTQYLDDFLPKRVWDAPFADKITGKGLKSINKPYFRNKDTKKGLIDYDLEEVSRVCKSYNAL